VVQVLSTYIDERKGELAVGIIDNIVHLAKGKISREANRKIKSMFTYKERAKQWAKEHCSEFEMNKLAVIGFTRKQKQCP
jgi:hypothetical protein